MKEFLKFKSDWLIKNNNLELIEEYLIKNQIINVHPELTTHLVNQYLSQANINKSLRGGIRDGICWIRKGYI